MFVAGLLRVVHPMRQDLPHAKALKVLESLGSYPVLPISESLFWAALAIRRQHQISYSDSAIIAAAAALGCRTLYSEDLNHGQYYSGVQVLNPFLD